MQRQPILLGVIGRPHGVRGHVHVICHAEHPDALTAYGRLDTPCGRAFSVRWVASGIAALTEHTSAGPRPVETRDQAAALTRLALQIDRAALPAPQADEFYLADLIGMQAVALDGTLVGTVRAVHDYGAGASIEIDDQLLPFTRACVPAIDLDHNRLTIDPPHEILVADSAGSAA